jgi:hypothetical protein
MAHAIDSCNSMTGSLVVQPKICCKYIPLRKFVVPSNLNLTLHWYLPISVTSFVNRSQSIQSPVMEECHPQSLASCQYAQHHHHGSWEATKPQAGDLTGPWITIYSQHSSERRLWGRLLGGTVSAICMYNLSRVRRSNTTASCPPAFIHQHSCQESCNISFLVPNYVASSSVLSPSVCI